MLSQFIAIMQGSPDTFTRWFYTNAPAAWISALIAIITCIFLVRSRKKPKKIVVRETRNNSLVKIWPSVRDKIAMTFAGQPVGGLGQIEAKIFNEGSEIIQRPTISLALPQKSRVLDTLITPESIDAETRIDLNKVTITLAYLNPFGEHAQILKLSVLVDGDTEPLNVTGMGEGWSVRHVPLSSEKSMLYQSLIPGIVTIAILLVNRFYGRYVEKMYGIPPSEISWRALLASLPLLIPLLIAGVWIVMIFFRTLWRIVNLRDSS